MDLIPAELVQREINYEAWRRVVGVTSEGGAHLDPIQFLPLSLIFAKADLLPVVLDALQYLIVSQAGVGINHTQKMLNQRVS